MCLVACKINAFFFGVCHLRWWRCFILYSGLARFIWAVATRGGSLHAWCTPSNLLQATCKGLKLVNDLTLQQVRGATSRMESSLTHTCFALLEGEEGRNDSQQAGSCSYTRAKPRDCVTVSVTVSLCSRLWASSGQCNWGSQAWGRLHYVICLPEMLPALFFLSEVKETVLGKVLDVLLEMETFKQS